MASERKCRIEGCPGTVVCGFRCKVCDVYEICSCREHVDDTLMEAKAFLHQDMCAEAHGINPVEMLKLGRKGVQDLLEAHNG